MSKHRRPLVQERKIVDRFNVEFPPGTAVTLRTDSGDVETFVTARAELLGGHSAVAWFAGISGAYSIADGRVRLRAATPAG